MSSVKMMTKDEHLKAINEIVNKIDDVWILWQVHRFLVNMTK